MLPIAASPFTSARFTVHLDRRKPNGQPGGGMDATHELFYLDER
jgi:hypothetical protein